MACRGQKWLDGRYLFQKWRTSGRFVRTEFFKDRTLIKPKNDGSRRVRQLITNKRLISKLNLGFRLKYLTTNLPGIEARNKPKDEPSIKMSFRAI